MAHRSTLDTAALAVARSLQQTSGGGRPSGAGSAAVGDDGASEGTVDNGAEPTLSSAMWSYPGPNSFKLRGRNYLRDKKKVGGETCFDACSVLMRLLPLVALVHFPPTPVLSSFTSYSSSLHTARCSEVFCCHCHEPCSEEDQGHMRAVRPTGGIMCSLAATNAVRCCRCGRRIRCMRSRPAT